MRSILGIVTTFLCLLATAQAEGTSEVEAVKAANQSYYTALSAREVWSQSADDVNVAPPVRPTAHVGWDAIKKNYQAFWGTLDELTVAMENPAVNIEGNVAWVYGIEHAKRRSKDGQVGGGPNFGTSIFVKKNGQWLMVFHQAALMPQQQPQNSK
jgi:ketosteroid isomerase-like protein